VTPRAEETDWVQIVGWYDELLRLSLRDTLPGLDDRNLGLVVTAIRHAAGQPSPHR